MFADRQTIGQQRLNHSLLVWHGAHWMLRKYRLLRWPFRFSLFSNLQKIREKNSDDNDSFVINMFDVICFRIEYADTLVYKLKILNQCRYSNDRFSCKTVRWFRKKMWRVDSTFNYFEFEISFVAIKLLEREIWAFCKKFPGKTGH